MLRDVGESFEESAQTKIDEEKKKTGVQVTNGPKIWFKIEKKNNRKICTKKLKIFGKI